MAGQDQQDVVARTWLGLCRVAKLHKDAQIQDVQDYNIGVTLQDSLSIICLIGS